MGMKLIRGRAEEIAAPDKDGVIYSRIGKYKIKLHRDVEDNVVAGDEVLVAGDLKGDVLHAVVVRNFRLDKTSQVDCTYYILLMGVSFVLSLLSGGLKFQSIGGDTFNGLYTVLIIGGLIAVGVSIQRFIFILAAARMVSYAES